jgi:hypothetical protein
MAPTRPVPTTLEQALYEVVHRSDQTIHVLADSIGKTYSYLADAANPNREGHRFQLRWVVPITRASGNDAIVRYLAHAVGGMFVRLQPAGVSMDAQTSAVLKEVGELLIEASSASADGKVTREEAEKVAREADQAIEALMAFKESMRRRASDDEPPAAPRLAVSR